MRRKARKNPRITRIFTDYTGFEIRVIRGPPGGILKGNNYNNALDRSEPRRGTMFFDT
jgi:hypothetical protein